LEAELATEPAEEGDELAGADEGGCIAAPAPLATMAGAAAAATEGVVASELS
jgi:hypothetical protein